MNIPRVMALAQRIIRQIRRDTRTLALIFIVPIVVMTLLDLVLTNTSSIYTLALVRPKGASNDRVNTLITQLLPEKDKLKIVNISSDQANTTLKNGDADAALIFPSNFTQEVATRSHPSVQLMLEGSDPSAARAIHDLTEGFIHQLGTSFTPLPVAPGKQLPSNAVNVNIMPFIMSEPSYLYGGPEYTLNDSLAPAFIGIFSFFFAFLLTSIAFLRERSQGTIERVMVSPLTRTEMVIGYICGFTLFALMQSLVILLFMVFVLKVHYNGNLALVFLVSALLTIGSVNLGIFLSTFAQNEFQVVQFIPLVFVIQILLSGLFWPIAQLPKLLQLISYLLPLTYANNALRGVMLKRNGLQDITGELMALLIFALIMVVLSSFAMRRRAV